ncbi:hypothetical protein SCLCIDRAFT_1113181 [Scleroderma citrinum Foug A]|uniref:Uncharacterized protein n=1 Tax=Scleroderma citrinum Foug A TaxID=1036808 RepID=A0A0C3EIB0_9AGAM|nr:hypothetical protein SCLCIDRAFT_1113181 [Scleroderma citrinum Foug A]
MRLALLSLVVASLAVVGLTCASIGGSCQTQDDCCWPIPCRGNGKCSFDRD